MCYKIRKYSFLKNSGVIRKKMKGKTSREAVLAAGFGFCVLMEKKINLSLIPFVN